MQKRILKEAERQAMLTWGYDPKEVKRKKDQEIRAKRWQEDPLWLFPNDIDYFTRDQVRGKVAVTKRFGRRINPDLKWDDERASACLGARGTIARRCSMNDKLWKLHRISLSKGVPFSLVDIKRLIMIDIKRSKLYPPGWQDDSKSPPQEYLDKLRNEGKLDRILEEIDEVVKWPMS